MRGRLFGRIAFWLAVWAGPLVRAQQMEVQSDRDSITYGQPVRVDVRVSGFGAGDTLRLLPVTGAPGVDVLKYLPWDTLQKNPPLWQTSLLVTAWDTGHYQIPAVKVTVGDTVLSAGPVTFRVYDVPVDSLKKSWLTPHPPVAPPAPGHPVKWQRHWTLKAKLWTLWILSVLIWAGLLVYLRRRKRNRPPTPAEIYRSSLDEWERLSRSKESMADADAFYVKLTGILRDYAERVLGIPARERVSKLLAGDLAAYRFENGAAFPKDLLDDLREMFRRADLAKFARFEPLQNMREADLDTVRRFLDFAQKQIDEIRRQREDEAARLAAERRKRGRRRRALLIAVAAVVLIPLSYGAYRLARPQWSRHWVALQWKWNDVPPPARWFTVAYGPQPSLAFRSPVVPRALDLPDSLHQSYPDVAVLTGKIPGGDLWVVTADGKTQKHIDWTQILEVAKIPSGLQAYSLQIKDDNAGKPQEVHTRKNEIWIVRLWNMPGHLRMLAVRIPNDSFHRQLARLIVSSARLIQIQNQGK